MIVRLKKRFYYMKKLLWIILFGVILTGCSASANQIKPQPPSKLEAKPLTKEEVKIEELIKQLGNDEWQIREKAQEELIKIGKNIKPILQKHENSPDPEVRLRIKQIMEEITPTKILIITPMEHGAPTSKTLIEIEKIEGIKVIDVKYKERSEAKRFYMIVTIKGERVIESLDKIRNIIKQNSFEELEEVPEGWQ